MRAAAGLIAFNGLLLALGLGVLGAAGLLRLRVREVAVAAPAALLVGAAVAGIAGTVVLVAGGTLALPPLVAGALVLGALLWAATFRRRARGRPIADPPDRPPADPRTARAERIALWALIAGVTAFVLLQAYLSRNQRPAWDAAHNWMLKAFALSTGGLDDDLFTTAGPFSGAHLDYPLLQPVLGALVFRFAGKGEHGLLVVELWLLAGAFAFAGPFLLGLRRHAWLAIVPLALVVAALTSLGILRGDADVTMAVLLAAGALALGRWLDGGPPGLAVVAALLLGGALNTKNEGLVFTAGLLAVAAVVLLVTERRRLLPFAGIALGVAALAAPWRAWLAANGPFAGDVTPLSTSLDLDFLSDRLGRLDFAARELSERFYTQTAHVWIMPTFLAVTVVLLIAGPRRRLPAFYLGGVLAALAMVLWVYWTTSQPDWAAHIERTALRTVTGPLFLAAAGLAHLLTRTAAELPVERR